MRRWLALALLVAFPWIGGLGQDARAGVTIDVVFQGATSQSGITINAGDPGSSGWCAGGYPYVPSPGYCMDVILRTTDTLVGVGASVAYETDNGLAVDSFHEWVGVGVSWNAKGTLQKSCAPMDGVTDDGSQIGSFDCVVPPPNLTTPIAPGTYRLGTIVWDTSGTTPGTERIWIVDATASVVINGNVPDIVLPPVLGSHILTIIPEPGTAALLGLGIVGLTLAARRRLS